MFTEQNGRQVSCKYHLHANWRCVGIHNIPHQRHLNQRAKERLVPPYQSQWYSRPATLSVKISPNHIYTPGRIPILLDHNQSPPFPVMETSAELLYLLKFYDKNDEFGFKDELERSQALQWLFFWHGSGAPYLGQLGHFTRAAKEKIPCMI